MGGFQGETANPQYRSIRGGEAISSDGQLYLAQAGGRFVPNELDCPVDPAPMRSASRIGTIADVHDNRVSSQFIIRVDVIDCLLKRPQWRARARTVVAIIACDGDIQVERGAQLDTTQLLHGLKQLGLIGLRQREAGGGDDIAEFHLHRIRPIGRQHGVRGAAGRAMSEKPRSAWDIRDGHCADGGR